MDAFYRSLKQKGFEGDIDTSDQTRQFYSHDASLFELVPQAVIFPKHANDLQRLVASVNVCRGEIPGLSITPRSAGTCMSGGSVGESVVIDFTKYLNAIENVTSKSAQVQPGVFYHDFEKATLAQGALLPTFPASRELCAIGGMVSNNAGGEKSLQYGKTENYVTRLDVVLADGKLHTLKALNKQELDAKMAQKDFEGDIYRKTFHLIDSNYDAIKNAKPKVSKNSTGYNLWDVWNRETGVFDLTKLIVGAQGTLGLVSDVYFNLINDKPHSGVLVAFMKKKNMEKLGELINVVVAEKPASFEAFDNYTLELERTG
jgi:FAD/FMN-containing dehydrogenase